MLMLGGIPWNCYFQRVLSCRTPARAQAHSLLAGALTIAFTLPPLLLGQAAWLHAWPADLAAQLQQQPSQALPMLLRHTMPPFVALLGLGAIVGAVTSSFSASILSAGSMFAWNGCYRLALTRTSRPCNCSALIRVSIVALGAGAAVLALRCRACRRCGSSPATWYTCCCSRSCSSRSTTRKPTSRDRSSRSVSRSSCGSAGGSRCWGSRSGFRYPEIFACVAAGTPRRLVRRRTLLFPFKTLAAGAGLVLLPLVSRATARWVAPRPLRPLDVRRGATHGGAACLAPDHTARV